ncbi:MAG: hypothetical protein ABH819_00670 [Patescibacteria group bacterium]
MNKFIKHLSLTKIIFCVFLLLFVLSFPIKVIAQDDPKTSAFNDIVDALNIETEEIFNDYASIVEEFDNENEEAALEFINKLPVWKSVFEKTRNVFNKYKSSNDSQILEISNLALDANSMALTAIDLYERAINSDTDADFNSYLAEADENFIEASDAHFKVVDIYNDYSGITSAFTNRNWLVFATILSCLFSFIIFLKSRVKNNVQAEIIRAAVYQELFSHSIWLAGGLLLTTIGYSYSLESGSTYYIFYGAIGIGGWKLLQGLYKYFTEGKKTLDTISQQEKDVIFRTSFKENETITNNNTTKKCPHCKKEISKKTIICPKCGENVS